MNDWLKGDGIVVMYTCCAALIVWSLRWWSDFKNRRYSYAMSVTLILSQAVGIALAYLFLATWQLLRPVFFP